MSNYKNVATIYLLILTEKVNNEFSVRFSTESGVECFHTFTHMSFFISLRSRQSFVNCLLFIYL